MPNSRTKVALDAYERAVLRSLRLATSTDPDDGHAVAQTMLVNWLVRGESLRPRRPIVDAVNRLVQRGLVRRELVVHITPDGSDAIGSEDRPKKKGSK